MNPIRRIRRIAAALAGLACAWLGLAVAAPAAFAAMSVPPPGSGSPGIASRPTPPGSYPCSPECSNLLTKHPPVPGQAAAAVAEHHQSLTGGLPAPLAAHIHQQAHQAAGPPPGHVTGAVLGPNRAGYPPVSHIHTVIVGGMPGWQIALIAAGAAILAAALAVILDRARAGRRHLAAPST
jgi:hypothetical protein